ncbi:hypothetical protein EMCRGX_G014391 [Ephydatia muelleri]
MFIRRLLDQRLQSLSTHHVDRAILSSCCIKPKVYLAIITSAEAFEGFTGGIGDRVVEEEEEEEVEVVEEEEEVEVVEEEEVEVEVVEEEVEVEEEEGQRPVECNANHKYGTSANVTPLREH